MQQRKLDVFDTPKRAQMFQHGQTEGNKHLMYLKRVHSQSGQRSKLRRQVRNGSQFRAVTRDERRVQLRRHKGRVVRQPAQECLIGCQAAHLEGASEQASEKAARVRRDYRRSKAMRHATQRLICPARPPQPDRRVSCQVDRAEWSLHCLHACGEQVGT